MSHHPRTRVALGLLMAGSLTAVAACSGGADSAAGSAGADGELTPVSIGTIPAILSAPLFVGIEEGIFEEHGLDVEVNFADGGAAVIPSVLSGENQFGYSNTVSLLAAFGEGLPLSLAHSAWAPHGELELDDHAVLVLPDSGITEPADLEGKNIAVNTLQNIGEVHIRQVFENLDLDADTLSWTQLPFADMSEALRRGDVDAIWVSEPFVAPALEEGWVRVISPGAQSFPEEVSGYYTTSRQFAESDPEVVAAFREAMAEVNEFAEENPELVREAATSQMGIDADVAAVVNLPMFPNDLDTQPLQDYAAAAVRFGILAGEPEDYDALIAPSS
ncbi:ABC transporter substrate-binding protein [Litorihabitans aurantiacus]|uniref:SsuA/THI5-like domain-containing protein n=1 Tax=Litorihabitans aurantiacus TaxID=1930061 RepID=A0AA37XGN8_9MICO|nr:ABC transporter substrate-binding protein [Litorihabitans aurantiacus]GMA32823.1 hypothetical protein GCM10025875_28150 [Litorihabitans aurantiacus]